MDEDNKSGCRMGNEPPEQLPSDEERAQLWSAIQRAVQKRKRRMHVVRLATVSIAACLCVMVGVGLWWRTANEQMHAVENQLVKSARDARSLALAGGGNVRLTLADGSTIQLEDESTINYRDSILEIHEYGSLTRQHQLAPEDGAAANYHNLYVPYGKRVEVLLPDGSTVWLNAGSTLTYPSTFADSHREVYLAGEGYFDIQHQQHQPFTVHTSDMQIRVLGTSFNVSAYDDDAHTSASLLEGSIALQSSRPNLFADVRMKPGDKATFDRNSDLLDIAQHDTEDDISWRKKQLMLQRQSIPDILKKIERVYNAKIVVNDDHKNQTFSGSLDVSKPIADVLAYLYPVDQFSITQEERRVAIRRK